MHKLSNSTCVCWHLVAEQDIGKQHPKLQKRIKQKNNKTNQTKQKNQNKQKNKKNKTKQ